MKPAFFFILFCISANLASSQRVEFTKFNGLIYPDSTIKQLKRIVDSLNLKFKVCELHKVYQSKQQAKAHYVSLEKRWVKEAKLDINNDIPFEDFIKKYSKAAIQKELLVVKEKYIYYDDSIRMHFTSLSLNPEIQFRVIGQQDIGEYNRPLKGRWVFNHYQPATPDGTESIEAFYFTEDFATQPLPVKYARMVQYSDCMVDTSTQVFYAGASHTGVRYDIQATPKLEAFYNYIQESIQWPDYFKVDSIDPKPEWFLDSVRRSLLYELKSKDGKAEILFNEAVKEALDSGSNEGGLEEYAAIFDSKKTALELKRRRIVVGGCSQDLAPRVHAFEIAKLAAETINWEIFLRSHLDIMNDRFIRATDGSYAQKERQTYIRELEVLDINVPDLLFGITLRIENPDTNHYYGDIGRLGRALSETKSPETVESAMLQMIADPGLDVYNRVVIYYLFQHYNHHVDKSRQQQNKVKLKKAVQTLPDYLSPN